MTKYYLTTPTEEYGPAGGGRLFIRYKLTRGLTLIRNLGVWSTTAFPTEDVLKEADMYYLGGHEYEISQAVYDQLVSAGYGANVRVV